MSNEAGADLSHHNLNIQFHEMAAATPPITWLGLKTTEGANNVDPTFADRRLRSHSVGFKRYTLYHFFRPLDDIDAQAHNYCAQVEKLQPREEVAIDLESTAGWDQLSPKESADRVIAWVAEVKENLALKDADFVLYGSMGWLRGQFGDELARLTFMRLWFAGGPNYNRRGAPMPGDVEYDVTPWPTWTYFQYGQYGVVPGAGSGDVDTDESNGPIAEVAA